MANTTKTKGVKFTTPEGRASYPAIFTPKEKYYPPGTKPAVPDYEYTIQVLFDNETDLKPFNQAVDKALEEVFGTNKTIWPENISRPLVDQAILIEKAQDKGQAFDQYKDGAFYAQFKTNAKQSKPIVVDQQMNEIINPTEVYGGCYVRVSAQIKVNVIDGKHPVTKKPIKTVYVNCYLQGVQKVSDGDSFGGRPNVSQMFEPITFDDEQVNPLG